MQLFQFNRHFQVHQQRLRDLKFQLEKKKQGIDPVTDGKYEQIKTQMLNNKIKTHEFQETEKIIEIKRNNKILLDRLMDISKGRGVSFSFSLFQCNLTQERLRPA